MAKPYTREMACKYPKAALILKVQKDWRTTTECKLNVKFARDTTIDVS